MRKDEEEEEAEPLSPMARVFQAPDMDCTIVTKIGFKTKINPRIFLHHLKRNVHKHPRFSSILSEDGERWIKIKVNVEDHVIVPDIDLEEIKDNGEHFIEDYISHLTTLKLDETKPLWDIHILNIKTHDAESVCVIRSHHSLGDAMSLMSFIVACTHKTSNLEASPMKRRETISNNGWFLLKKMRLIWNTIVDIVLSLSTLLFLKDTDTPLKGSSPLESTIPRRFVHQIVSMDDIKLIKEAMNMTINDVLLGVTQAALSTYLNSFYDKNNEEGGTPNSTLVPNNLLSRLRIRAGVFVNLRPGIGIQKPANFYIQHLVKCFGDIKVTQSKHFMKPLEDMMAKDSKCRWGNYISVLLLPLFIGLETNPLVYLSKTKSSMDRKKNSLHASILYSSLELISDTLGTKVAAELLKRAMVNTTTLISNVIGPMEELSFHGYPIAYIAPSVYGHPQALLIHFQSYVDKMIISIAVDPTVISDPHKICQEMENSLNDMKASLSERGLL